jgi:hypothetical protein
MKIEPIKIDDNFKEMFLAVLESKSISNATKEKIVTDIFSSRTMEIDFKKGDK